jgi:hypothetical protein
MAAPVNLRYPLPPPATSSRYHPATTPLPAPATYSPTRPTPATTRYFKADDLNQARDKRDEWPYRLSWNLHLLETRLEHMVKHAEELQATFIVQLSHLIDDSQLSALLQKSELMKFCNQWAFVWEKQKKDSSTNLLQDWRIPPNLLKRWNTAKYVDQRVIWKAGIITLRRCLLHVNKQEPGHHLDKITRMFEETQFVGLEQLKKVTAGEGVCARKAEKFLSKMWEDQTTADQKCLAMTSLSWSRHFICSMNIQSYR